MYVKANNWCLSKSYYFHSSCAYMYCIIQSTKSKHCYSSNEMKTSSLYHYLQIVVLLCITFHDCLCILHEHFIKFLLWIVQWVNLPFFHTRTFVVNITMFCLICTDSIHHIKYSAFFSKSPISSSNGWGPFCSPVRHFIIFRCFFNTFNDIRVCVACFFLCKTMMLWSKIMSDTFASFQITR